MQIRGFSGAARLFFLFVCEEFLVSHRTKNLIKVPWYSVLFLFSVDALRLIV